MMKNTAANYTNLGKNNTFFENIAIRKLKKLNICAFSIIYEGHAATILFVVLAIELNFSCINKVIQFFAPISSFINHHLNCLGDRSMLI